MFGLHGIRMQIARPQWMIGKNKCASLFLIFHSNSGLRYISVEHLLLKGKQFIYST